MHIILINFNTFKNMREKRNNSLYAEINTHDEYGYMSTSIWSYQEVCEMISHSSRKPVSQVQDLIDLIVNGEEVSFRENKTTSIFRLATEADMANAERDEIHFRKELEEFANSPHDTNIEKILLKQLGFDNEKNTKGETIMEKLVKIPGPKILANYQFGEWIITIAESEIPLETRKCHNFYLTGLCITDHMFSLPEDSYSSMEEIIMNNLEEYIRMFKDNYDACDEIKNPFDEE